MDVVPGLVEKETPIPYFLQAAEFDPLKAAQRLARFWKFRRVIFSERWLLPMTQTGAGALSDMDIQFVRTGFVFLMARDNTGPLIVVDFSKAINVFKTARALGWDTLRLVERVGMYVCIAFMDEFSRGPSTLMHPVTSKERPEMEIRTQFWEMVQTAFPGRLTEVVVAQRYEEGKQELLDFLRYQSARVLQAATRITPQQICANSTIQTANLLEGIGIRRNIVPIELGGTFQYDNKVAEWTRTRLGIETFLAPIPNALPKHHNVMEAFGRPGNYRHKKTPLLKRKADSEQQSEYEYRLERNRVYGKRYIQKGNLELLSLEGQKRQLEHQRQALLFQNLQLERAIQSAREMVAQHEQAQCPAEHTATATTLCAVDPFSVDSFRPSAV